MFKLSKWTKQAVFAVLAACTVLAVLFAPAYPVFAAQAPVGLGTADSFAVLAGTAVTNVPTSAIIGNVGLSPAAGSNYAGLTTPQVTGTIYAVDASGPAGSVNNPGLLTIAKADLVTAYDDAAGRSPVTVPTELGGTTKAPGVYNSGAGTFEITGTLILDGQGDPDAVFIFQMASTLVTAANNSIVSLINDAQACNVFWQVGSSATLETYTTFVGTILALTSITVKTGATVDGRVLARNGAVTMDTNTITVPVCEIPTPTVGGEASAINKAYVLAPWLGLGLVLVFGGTLLLRRRTSR